jgi:hypothetical protein
MAITGIQRLRNKLLKLTRRVDKKSKVKVGFLAGATYANGTPVAMVAAIQNFGAPARGIPPRPFFSSMIADKQAEWGPAAGRLLKDNDYDSLATLEQIGQGIAGQLRQSIIDTNDPPLSPVTLMLRKMRTDNPDLVVTGKTVGEAARRVADGDSYGGVSTKPLVDIGPEGGHMLQSVDYKVTTGD